MDKLRQGYSVLNYPIHQGSVWWMLNLPVFYSDHPPPDWLMHLPDDDWIDLCSVSRETRHVEFSEDKSHGI